jgi:hypothetical protein
MCVAAEKIIFQKSKKKIQIFARIVSYIVLYSHTGKKKEFTFEFLYSRAAVAAGVYTLAGLWSVVRVVRKCVLVEST